MSSFKQAQNIGSEKIDISGLKDFLANLTEEDKKVIRDQIRQGVIVEKNSSKETIAILDTISNKLSDFQNEYNLSDSDFKEAIIFCLDSLSEDTLSVTDGIKGRVINIFGFEGNKKKGRVQAWAYYREDIIERANNN